jgi:circadian clock protein KaiB
MDDETENTQQESEKPLEEPDIYKLRLYIAGQTPKSRLAFNNLKRICEVYLASKCQIETIDLLIRPQCAKEEQILAIPTVIRKFPLPERKIIGDVSNTQRVLVGLDLRPLKE